MTYSARCLLPFHHIAIRPNNKVYPCCQFRWEHVPDDLSLEYPDVFNHPFMGELRQHMKTDTKHPGCSQCYDQERMSGGTKSMRLEYLEKLGTDIPETPTITHVDLALSNVCNNRCRMCGPELSTNWYADAKALGQEYFEGQHSGIKNSVSVLSEYDLSKLRFIKLIGGEPLMEQEKFIEILRKCDRSNLTILLTTNATKVPKPELFALLKECKKVRVSLSIDGFGKMNDFLRKGSKWETVVNAIDWFWANFPDNVYIHTVISIYTINNFWKLHQFVKERYGEKLYLEYQMVDGVSWMYPRNLPQSAKDYVLEKVKNLGDKYVFEMVQAELANVGSWELFNKMDSKLNALRMEDWRTINRELCEITKQ